MGLRIPAAGRTMGLRVVSARGTGKSRLLGRRLVVGDFDRGIAQVVFDPVGDTMDNALDVFRRRPLAERNALAERIVYVDVSARSGFVCSLPVYHAAAGDSLYETAMAPVNVWQRIDPALGQAPIMGLNPVLTTGTYLGIILAALGWRVTEAEALVSEPKRFEAQVRAIATTDPKVAEAVSWLLEKLPHSKTAEWRQKTDSYLNKTRQLTLENGARATYGASAPGINWEDVVKNGSLVLLDFRHVEDQLLSFGLVWWFRSLFGFIKRRGSGRHTPLGVVIDELWHFLSSDPRQQDVLAKDFQDLVVVRSRSHSIWLSISHQELNQLSEGMAKVLMSMGTQIFGATSDLEGGAEVWAKRFDHFDPRQAKSYRNVWGSSFRGPDYVREEQPIFATMQEQIRVTAQDNYLRVPPLTFWGAVSQREGHLGDKPQRFVISTDDGFVQEERVAAARLQLAERSGRPIAEVLAEIDRRLEPPDTILEDNPNPRPRGMPVRSKKASAN